MLAFFVPTSIWVAPKCEKRSVSYRVCHRCGDGLRLPHSTCYPDHIGDGRLDLNRAARDDRRVSLRIASFLGAQVSNQLHKRVSRQPGTHRRISGIRVVRSHVIGRVNGHRRQSPGHMVRLPNFCHDRCRRCPSVHEGRTLDSGRLGHGADTGVSGVLCRSGPNRGRWSGDGVPDGRQYFGVDGTGRGVNRGVS
jgi:hypothetical protein